MGGNCLHFARPPHVDRGRSWSPGSSGRFCPVNLEDSMMRSLSVLVLAILLAASAGAADVKYALNGENTQITFVGTKPGGMHTGGFKKLTGAATVTDGTMSMIEVEIDTDSLYSDNEKLTGHLKSPDFFGVKDNPKATFKTTKVEKTDKGYTITGDLTMIGKTKSVSFPASATENGGALSISTSFPIDRTEWGMNYGKGKIDDKVMLKVAVTAKK
jgi:polyisoprenoid-binding protein YceI